MESGIYQIRNLIDDKIYIGQAQNFRLRKNNHFSRLDNNCHDNKHLQNAFNKYGKSNFVFEKLVEIDGDLNEIETTMINAVPLELRYNIALEGSAPFKNRKHTEETRKKMSESMKGKNVGKTQSIESNQRRAESSRGKPKPIGFGAKISEASKGEKAFFAILTEIQVREIKFKHFVQDILTQKEIGEIYNVSNTTISHIARGRTWKHIV